MVCSALRVENARRDWSIVYVKIGSGPDTDATAFRLPGGCYVGGYSGFYHAKVGVRRKAHVNPLFLFGDAQ